MSSGTNSTGSKIMYWIGWVISAPIFLMGAAGCYMVFHPDSVYDGFGKYGYPRSSAIPILIVEIACVVIYAVPQTAMLGAILLTGYLGGATATHVRAGEPWFAPVIAGVLVWLGLYLRDRRVRALVPFR